MVPLGLYVKLLDIYNGARAEHGTRRTPCVDLQAEFYFENGTLNARRGDNT
jgi:hypothetical protein